jgi:hypothetical protein
MITTVVITYLPTALTLGHRTTAPSFGAGAGERRDLLGHGSERLFAGRIAVNHGDVLVP